MSFGKG